MGLMDKAREAAEQARAGVLGERAAAPDGEPGDAPAPPPPPPGARASAAINSLVERINPGLLADLIIHATAAQEKTNQALREKGSQYRISEMYLTATIPPQVGFYIARVGDDPADAVPAALPPGEPVKEGAAAKKRAPRAADS